MNRRGQAVQRLVSFVVQRKDSSGMVPRIGNALIKATYEGTVKAGGPPRVTVSPFMHMLSVRGYPCASSLGLPPPEKHLKRYKGKFLTLTLTKHVIGAQAPKGTLMYKIVVRFNAANTDEFIALADEIESERGDLVVDGVESDVPRGTFVIATEDGDILEEGSLESMTASKVLDLVEQPSDYPKQAVAGQDCVI